MRPPGRTASPRRTVLGLLGGLATGVAGCLGAPASDDSAQETRETSSEPTDATTTQSLPPGVVAYDSLTDRQQRVVDEAVTRERAVADYSVVKALREYDAVRYEDTTYRIAVDWIVAYDIRPEQVDCAEAGANETVTYANLSTAGRTAFDTAREEGSYDAPDYEFPTELRTHDYVRVERNCYWLYRLHEDTSMYEVRLEPVDE